MAQNIEQNIVVSTRSPPISRLSQDILSHIFLLVATDRPAVNANNRAKSIASFSRVSREWRQTVLDYPSLWSYVVDYYAPLKTIKHRLDLCGDALLEFGHRSDSVIFIWEEEREKGDQVVKLIIPYAAGLRSFNFCGRTDADNSWSMIQSEFLPNSAPQIEYLGLRRHPNNDPTCLLETSLFSDQAPSLRTIHLEGCVLPLHLSPKILGNLCELQVKGLNPHPKAPKLDQWVELLDLLPQLRWLTIVDSILPSGAITSRSSLRFDQLKMLYLRASPSDCTTLLRAMSIPTACGIRIEAEIIRRGEDLQTLSTLVSERIKPSSRVSQRHWMIQCFPPEIGRPTFAEDYWLCFMNRGIMQSDVGADRCPGWDSPDDGSGTGEKDPFIFVLFTFPEYLESEMAPAHELLLKAFTPTYSSTTGLTVSFLLKEDHGPPMVDSIVNRLHLFKQMERLELYDSNNSRHRYFMVPEDASKLDSIPIPSLREVEIGSNDAYEYPPSFFEFFRWRKAQGNGVHRIKLSGVVMNKQGVNSELSATVEVVDLKEAWDPNQDEDMDDSDGDDDGSDVDMDNDSGEDDEDENISD